MNDFDQGNGSTREPPDPLSDRIDALLRATGRRPAVAPDRAERVHAAVRAHWQAEVGRRVRRRTVWAAALAAAATVVVAFGLGAWRRAGGPPSVATAGRVEIIVASAWSEPASGGSSVPRAALRPGDDIEVGWEVGTDDEARLAVRLTTGHSVRLDGGTRVRVLSERVFALDRGAVYVDSRGPDGTAQEPVEIRTRLGSIRDTGTQFEARLDGSSLRVRVREGAVFVDRDEGRLEVSAGLELEVSADGRTSRSERTAFGAEWSWIGEITPMMELEERSLREFLDWIVRERGLRLAFETDDLASSASGVVLSGSIQGMTLDQALESVLPTCRMRHRIDRDVLLVGPADEPASR